MKNSVSKFTNSPINALQWHIEMGVDETIGETPIDRHAAPMTLPIVNEKTSLPIEEKTHLQRPTSGPELAPAEGAKSAVEIAAAAQTIEDLRTSLEAFQGCALKFTATNTVFADGNPNASLMFIGEAPGVEEDRQGVPFVGASGQLLNRILAGLGYKRSSIYISNIIFWRPPGNRNPTTAERASCLPFVRRHIELVRPKILVLLGGSAAKCLLDRNEGIMRLRGKWFDYISDRLETSIPAMPTFHPAFLLRQPAQKRETWQDFLAIQERLEQLH